MQKYEIVKRYIDEMDYDSLLSGGAPGNEFDTESQEVSDKITDALTEQEIAQVIADVFRKSFDCETATTYFMDCARKIYADMHR